MNTTSETPKTAIDPVCGMEVNSATSTIKATFDGATYYFCADGCRRSFENEPCKYLAPKRKSLWGRYMDRLQKATGGKAMKCH